VTTDPSDDPAIIWRPTARQAVALAQPISDLFFGGGRGGGKSDFLLLDWFSHAEQQGPVAGIMLRRTLPELEEIEHRALGLFPRLGLDWKAADRTWAHPNGSFLRLRYLETVADASRYQGHQYQWIGIDEAGNYPNSAVCDLLRGCLRTTKPGQDCLLRLTGNPGGAGHGWLKARYVTPSAPEVPFVDADGQERVYIPSLLSDNPHIQDAENYRRQLAQSGPPHLVRAWLHGDWDVLPNGGILLPGKIVDRKPVDRERMRIYIGIDPACTDKDKTAGDPDYTAIAVVGVDESRDLHILEVWRGQVSTLTAWNRLRGMMFEYQPEVCWVEGGPIGGAVLPFWKEAQDREKTWWTIKEVSHAGDKVGKAQALSAVVERGLVSADYRADWWPALRDEMTVFDGSKNRKDDQVDALAIVARELRKMTPADPAPAARAIVPARSTKGLGTWEDLSAVAGKTRGGLAQRSAFGPRR
jgi:predicted phage terminase large subunit-like protein